MRARLGAWSAVLLASALLAGCAGNDDQTGRHDAAPTPGSGTSAPSSATPTEKSSAAASQSDSTSRAGPTLPNWPTYHRTKSRAGHVSSSPGEPLHRAWTQRLRGAVYGEPLLVDGTLVVATERNYVYGLDPRTGNHRWRVHLGRPQPLSGLPCGNIDPLGITGTPAYDHRTGSVFVVAETLGGHHTLWALSPRTGDRRWHRGLDVLPNRNRKAEQQRSALLVTDNRVIVAFGGLAGDCDNYVGYATTTPTTGQGSTHHYAVPTAREAGIWAPPGPVRGRNGSVYLATGNGAELNGRWDKSDSVTELSPVRLRRLAVFAPSTWREDNAADLDLGSSSPIPVNHRIVIAGKRGTVYLLRPRLGGVGAAIDTVHGCAAFASAAVVGHTVLMPCLGQQAIRALHVGRSSLRWGWTASGLYGSPVIAGHRVYVADRFSGDLYVLSLGTGKVLQRIHAGSLPHFPSQIVSGHWVFVPTLTGVTAFRAR
ncbi:MAG TPA: PQQ-binding-like beta-propeller repeat protein [Nocardioidaceae bacterium]|nr:PQQ-binding-like beta-propeller repeat protein [Nocardioidaceae bacterium]